MDNKARELAVKIFQECGQPEELEENAHFEKLVSLLGIAMEEAHRHGYQEASGTVKQLVKEAYERAEQWSAPEHRHRNTVYVRCNECLIFGVPMPGEYQCGNCGSHDTVSYNPSCCTESLLGEAMEEHTDELMESEGMVKFVHDRENEAYERAAKVAEEWPGPGGIVECDSMEPNDVMNGQRAGIVKAIRRLKEGVLNEDH